MAFTYLPTLKSHVLKQCGKLRRKKQARLHQAMDEPENGHDPAIEETPDAEERKVEAQQEGETAMQD